MFGFVFCNEEGIDVNRLTLWSTQKHTLSSYNGPDTLRGESDTFPVLQKLIKELKETAISTIKN